MQAESAVAMPTMQKPRMHHWLAALFMVACFIVAWSVTPHQTWYGHLGKPVFEEVMPRQFGDWADTGDAGGSMVVDPQQQGALDAIYSQIVSRTYVHKPSGRIIMLSLAYGDEQSYIRQLHRPESCYSSQGLKIESLNEEVLEVPGKQLAVVRMTATSLMRREQVSYFIRVGDTVISGPPNALNKARIAMAVKGFVADGLLFRVSELAESPQKSNPLHDQFIRDFLAALDPAKREMLIGPG
jgi:EpsI family protein